MTDLSVGKSGTAWPWTQPMPPRYVSPGWANTGLQPLSGAQLLERVNGTVSSQLRLPQALHLDGDIVFRPGPRGAFDCSVDTRATINYNVTFQVRWLSSISSLREGGVSIRGQVSRVWWLKRGQVALVVSVG